MVKDRKVFTVILLTYILEKYQKSTIVSATLESITPLLPSYLRNGVNPFFTQATFQWSNLLSGGDLPDQFKQPGISLYAKRDLKTY